MNLPNKLTMLRMVMIPFFIACFYIPTECREHIAAIIFILAYATDVIDGKYARKHNLVTDFGKLMDPIADNAYGERDRAPDSDIYHHRTRICNKRLQTCFGLEGQRYCCGQGRKDKDGHAMRSSYAYTHRNAAAGNVASCVFTDCGPGGAMDIGGAVDLVGS